MLAPTMPPPMITTWARSGTSAAMLASVGVGAVPSPLWSEEILFTFRALPVVGPGPPVCAASVGIEAWGDYDRTTRPCPSPSCPAFHGEGHLAWRRLPDLRAGRGLLPLRHRRQPLAGRPGRPVLREHWPRANRPGCSGRRADGPTGLLDQLGHGPPAVHRGSHHDRRGSPR